MPDFLKEAWRFLSGIPRAVFGDLIDSGLGIAASTGFVLVAIIFCVAGWRNGTEWAKGFDNSWSQKNVDEDNQGLPQHEKLTVNWRKAREQQVFLFRFAIPFGLMILASMAWLLWGSFTIRTAAIIGVLWLIFSPVLRFWWVATYVWMNRSLNKHGLIKENEQVVTASVWTAYQYYVAWGVAKSSSTTKKRLFRRKLKKFNGLIKLFRLDWLRMRLIKPLIACAMFAAIWPLWAPIALIELVKDLNKDQPLFPEWGGSRTKQPFWNGAYVHKSPKPITPPDPGPYLDGTPLGT